MKKLNASRRSWTCALAIAVAALCVSPLSARAQTATLLNVSYDPTREFYKEFNEVFLKHWQDTTGQTLTIRMSHGGSGRQARAVIDGLSADVVTLALAHDIDEIAARTGKIPANWATRLPRNSAPYVSTIVFLVRKGNPKDIKDWADLARPDIKVVTPNPKTSGGARWNYLAAWAWATKTFQKDEAKIKDYMSALLRNVPVFDTGARGSTTTFAQRGIGDVLITWENEAFLAFEEFGKGNFEIITPSMSILAEPSVAVVEGNTEPKKLTEAARAYLAYLYGTEGQRLAAKHYFRPNNPETSVGLDLSRFPKLDLVTIDNAFGGWAKAQAEHFSEGGTFDQLSKARSSTP